MLNTDYTKGTLRREEEDEFAQIDAAFAWVERVQIALIVVIMISVTLWWVL